MPIRSHALLIKEQKSSLADWTCSTEWHSPQAVIALSEDAQGIADSRLTGLQACLAGQDAQEQYDRTI